jgi:hypothetical protein
MLLQHIATFDIAELSDIANVTTVNGLIRGIRRNAERQDPDFYDHATYKGDCWEVFGEFFFKFFNGDHTLTYTADYEPNTGYDRGIDGRGVSTLDGKSCVIQHKFKADPTVWLTNDDNISNIIADACVNEGLILNGKNVIIFTSCKGVHPKHAMANVHTINLDQIKRRVDHNVVFWSDFQSVIKETVNAAC